LQKNISDQHCDDHMTLDCVRPTQFNVIQIFHCNVGMKCYLFVYQNACLLLSLYIYISFIFYKAV